MMKHSEEFKQEAVRIALTSGLSRQRVAKDLGIGKSTLGKWLAQYRPSDLVSAPQADLARENERLRLENRVLKEEKGILKKAQNALGSSSRASAQTPWRKVCARRTLAWGAGAISGQSKRSAACARLLHKRPSVAP